MHQCFWKLVMQPVDIFVGTHITLFANNIKNVTTIVQKNPLTDLCDAILL